MKQTFIVLFGVSLCLFVNNLFAQTAITAASTSYVTATSGTTYSASGATGSPLVGNTYTYNYGNLSGTANNDKQVNNFTAGGLVYTFLPIASQYVKMRRVNNAVVSGIRFLKFDEGTISGSTVNIAGSYDDDMEHFFIGNKNFNSGTDNLFGNQGDGNGNNNNIERVDVIYPNGITASDNSKVGFAIFERGATGAHDPVKAAVILAIDGTGKPTSYSSIVSITSANYGDVVAATDYVIARRDTATETRLKASTTTNQLIGGVLFKYSDFGIANNTTIYGYSVIPNDFSGTSAQLVDYTNATYFPTNTSSTTGAGGIDLVSFTGISQSSPVVKLPISGNVFRDANGLTDATVNGTGTNDGGLLYVQLVNSGNTVVATVAVNSDGTYSFPAQAPGTYSIVLNTSSTASTTAALPAGWINTGEFLGTTAGSDGTVNGILTSVVISSNEVTDANFAIEQIPTANAVTASSQANPGGTVKITVPTLNGSDPEQGSLPGTGNADTVIINTLPNSSTMGKLYYNGAAVTAGDTIKNYNPALLKLDPVDGAVTATFTYSEVDAALKSSSAATVSMSFTTISISGNVYDDANGLTDGTVNGTGTNAGGLNAVLYDAVADTVVAKVVVAANGTYSFSSLNAGNYSVEITTNSATVGAAPPAVALPAGYVKTGEYLGAGTGNDGTVNGILSIGSVSSNVINANFGIQQPPTANAVTASSQVNPGGAVKVTVPTLNGTDPEQGTLPGTGNLDTVIINTLPNASTMGKLYYNGAAVTAGDTIKNYNPTLLKFDPVDGAVTATFTYSEVDAALNSSSPATVSMSFTTISIIGNVYDDANGLTDGIVNGTGTNGGSLNAVLYDAVADTVVAKVTVAANGTYSFSGINAGNYSIEITTNSATVGAVPPAVALPAGYVKTGEFLGSGSGSDGSVNGILSIGSVSSNVTNANFGIEQLPTANAVTAAIQANPGGTTQVVVPTLNGSDPEQGTFAGTGNGDTIIIKTLPVNGTLYYNGSAVNAGDTIKNYNPSLLKLDPNDGAITSTFTYAEVDASLQSSTAATVTMQFTTMTISGNVYDDANGLKDNTVNGTGTNAGGQLYAQLLNSVYSSIAVVPVASDGTYSFSGLSGGSYTVVLNTSSTLYGNAALPAGWVNTGEHTGTGTGNDGSIDGVSAGITLSSGDIGNINFGIEKTPSANAVNATSQVNPGGTNTVQVPALGGTDAEDGTIATGGTITIATLPVNGTLYYNGVEVTAGVPIANYDPTKLTIDPNDGAITVSFTYTVTDAAGVASAPATVNIPFTTLTISGNIYEDANGLTDNTVNRLVMGNGDGSIAGGSNVVLIDANTGLVVAKAVITGGGTNGSTYSFSGLNAGNYYVEITTTNPVIGNSAPAVVAPVGWINTGENIGPGPGSDGTVDGKSSTINLLSSNVTNVNFGLEALPTANDVTAASQVNPEGTNTVVVPTLNGSDPEEGTFTGVSGTNTLIINTLAINGILYYNGAAVAAGDTIKNYDPALLVVDPDQSPFVIVSFTYSEVDAAGRASTPATVNMPFTSTLPVSLTTFTANVIDKNVDLSWSSSSEINTKYYEVERSSDGIHYTAIYEYPAKGSSNAAAFYQASDKLAVNGINYYRLKMVDASGSISYSKVITVIVDRTTANVLVTTSPNPFVNSVDVNLNLKSTSKIQVIISDLSGKTVYNNLIKGTSGINKININSLSKLPAGTYIMNVITDEGSIHQKIIKRR